MFPSISHFLVFFLNFSLRPAKISAVDVGGKTPLWRAANEGHENVVVAMIASDRELDTRTPLEVARAGSRTTVISWLEDYQKSKGATVAKAKTKVIELETPKKGRRSTDMLNPVLTIPTRPTSSTQQNTQQNTPSRSSTRSPTPGTPPTAPAPATAPSFHSPAPPAAPIPPTQTAAEPPVATSAVPSRDLLTPTCSEETGEYYCYSLGKDKYYYYVENLRLYYDRQYEFYDYYTNLYLTYDESQQNFGEGSQTYVTEIDGVFFISASDSSVTFYNQHMNEYYRWVENTDYYCGDSTRVMFHPITQGFFFPCESNENYQTYSCGEKKFYFDLEHFNGDTQRYGQMVSLPDPPPPDEEFTPCRPIFLLSFFLPLSATGGRLTIPLSPSFLRRAGCRWL